ncbi:hypothetical protein [Bradyrhizobium sp. USDA 4473]
MTLEAFLLQMARNGVESHLPKGTVRFEGKEVDCTMSAVREIVVQAAEGTPIPATFDMDTIVRHPHLAGNPIVRGPERLSVQGRGRGLRFQFRLQGRAEEGCAGDVVREAGRLCGRTEISGHDSRGTFLPFSEFDGLAPGDPSRLDGRSARDSETIASVREILAGRRL